MKIWFPVTSCCSKRATWSPPMAGSWKPRGGESQPVEKTGITLEDPELALGDRTNMLFMNTDVSRGRAVMVVTGTGMDTQIGNLATVLQGAGDEKTPLQKRIDQLARLLTGVALAVVTVVFVLGLVRGLPWSELLITAVSLAVATIPEGLTAVVTFTLAMGCFPDGAPWCNHQTAIRRRNAG